MVITKIIFGALALIVGILGLLSTDFKEAKTRQWYSALCGTLAFLTLALYLFSEAFGWFS